MFNSHLPRRARRLWRRRDSLTASEAPMQVAPRSNNSRRNRWNSGRRKAIVTVRQKRWLDQRSLTV